MTCIVALKQNNKMYLAGDSIGYGDYTWAVTRKDPKVFKVKGRNILVGYTTSFRMGQLLMFNSKIFPKKGPYNFEYMVTKVVPNLIKVYEENGFEKKQTDGQRDGGTFIVAFKDKFFEVQDDFQVQEVYEPFSACGCGRSTALASLMSTTHMKDPLERLRIAMEVTAKIMPGVAGPFKWVTMNDSGEL